jgi:16S rRNA processing protein RimM
MDLVTIGKIIKTRGVKGEVKVYPYTDDDCMEHYCSLPFLWVGRDEESSVKHKIERARVFQKYFLLVFDGIDEPQKALALMQNFLFVPSAQRADLKEDEVLIEDLVGSEVFQLDGKKLGLVVNFFHNGANGVCEVKRSGAESNTKKNFLFPITKQILHKVIREEKKLIIDPLKGMLE